MHRKISKLLSSMVSVTACLDEIEELEEEIALAQALLPDLLQAMRKEQEEYVDAKKQSS